MYGLKAFTLTSHIVLLISVDGLKKWSNVKKTGPLVRWSPPREQILKWNVDGSTVGKPGVAGIGGVLRDHQGIILGVFSIPVGTKK